MPPTRLLSFLSDFEKSLAADDPSPNDGSWETSRAVNYHQGLARLVVGVRTAGGRQNRGSVLLQSYALADGTRCLKAVLAWEESPQTVARSIYSKFDTDWAREARTVAAEWMAGAPATPAESEVELLAPLAAAG